MLAYEAHDAARSHRATAERALHDYAAVAAWELVAGVNDELQSSVGGALAPLTRARATSPYELLAARRPCSPRAPTTLLRCAAPAERLRALLLSRRLPRRLARDRRAATLSPAMRRWLVDTMTSHARSDLPAGLVIRDHLGGPTGEERVDDRVRGEVRRTSRADRRVRIAHLRRRRSAPTMIRSVMARRALLPASVTAGAAHRFDRQRHRRDTDGRSRSSRSRHATASPYVGRGAARTGGIAARARDDPSARRARLLALGAIPQSRVPILVGLLTLTAAMVGVTVHAAAARARALAAAIGLHLERVARAAHAAVADPALCRNAQPRSRAHGSRNGTRRRTSSCRKGGDSCTWSRTFCTSHAPSVG